MIAALSHNMFDLASPVAKPAVLNGTVLLDSIYENLHYPERVAFTMSKLQFGLRQLKRDMSASEWMHFIQNTCYHHPLRHLLHEDPLSRRTFYKPRGYAGDSVMIDLIYGMAQEEVRKATLLGQMVYNYVYRSPAADAVRNRKNILTKAIDDCATEKSQPHVLSVASGHLRELFESQSFYGGQLGRVVALDSDVKSCEKLSKEGGPHGLEVVQEQIDGLISKNLNLGSFDLIYSAGLFDYLPNGVASYSIRAMFRMLKPGGRLIVANFVPDVLDVGYMEAFMNWHLVTRDRGQLLGISRLLKEEEVAARHVFYEWNKNILFLDIHKAL